MRVIVLFVLTLPVVRAAQFAEHTVASDLKGGYQVVAADVNHDGKIDLIALGSGQTDLVWYENPTWRRHVIASGMRRMINLAYRNDQIALASEFENNPNRSVGIVSLLVPNGDPTRPWNLKEIDRLPTSHRLRWADIEGNGKKVLVNAPLLGSMAQAPEYRGSVPLVLYRPGEWKRELIGDANQGVQHGILVIDWDGDGREALLTASFSGIILYQYQKNREWKRTEITSGRPAGCPQCGSSDVAVGRVAGERFIAAIEPWHGNELAVYRNGEQGWKRVVIDDSLIEGHTILTADLDGNGSDQIIAGFRGGGGSVLIYTADLTGSWAKSVLDKAIPANACTVADLSGHHRQDIACIGGSLLKWYEHLGIVLALGRTGVAETTPSRR